MIGPLASAEAASVLFSGAGDIATCSSSGDEATAKLLDGISGRVFAVGDTVHEKGTSAEFSSCYAPSWGRHRSRTKPVPGNHEYETPGASGYYDYFGASAGSRTKGYYSYEWGDWHIVALNSMCERVGGCSASAPMLTWLRNDLAAHPAKCNLAYFHHPFFSSGGGAAKTRPTWNALYAAGVDVVLSGHHHFYERFAPQRPDGTLDTTGGIRQFVVGTGG